MSWEIYTGQTGKKTVHRCQLLSMPLEGMMLILWKQEKVHGDAQVAAVKTSCCSTPSSNAHEINALLEFHVIVRYKVSNLSSGHCDDTHHQGRLRQVWVKWTVGLRIRQSPSDLNNTEQQGMHSRIAYMELLKVNPFNLPIWVIWPRAQHMGSTSVTPES